MYFTTFIIAALASSPVVFAAQDHHSQGGNGYSHEGGFAHSTGRTTRITTHQPHVTGRPNSPCPSNSRNGTHHRPTERPHISHPSGGFSHTGRPHQTSRTQGIPTTSITISDTSPEPTESADVYERHVRRWEPLKERKIPATEEAYSSSPNRPKPTKTCTTRRRPHSTGGYPRPSGGFPHPSSGFPRPTGGYTQPTGRPGHQSQHGGNSGFKTSTKTSTTSERPTEPVYAK